MAQRLSQLLAPGAGAPVPPAALAWVLWSFGRSGYRPPGALLRRVEAALRRGSCVELYGLEPADVSRLCWGLAELRHYSGELRAAGDLGSLAASRS